jgi:hypothetical protein
MFFEFVQSHLHKCVLVIHELGVVAIDWSDNQIWTVTARDMLTDCRIAGDGLLLKEEGFRELAIDLKSGRRASREWLKQLRVKWRGGTRGPNTVKKMKKSLIDQKLILLGYRREASLLYRASFSTNEVEHFILFSFWGPRKCWLSAGFSLRNNEAEEFGWRCAVKYGSELYKYAAENRSLCALRFPLGVLADWSPRSSLYLPDMTDDEVLKRIEDAVQQKLLPLTRNIAGLEALLQVLENDSAPFRWLYTDGGIRAAQVAYIARRLGLQSSQIREKLRPYLRELIPSLGPGADLELYLENIIRESESIEPSRP